MENFFFLLCLRILYFVPLKPASSLMSTYSPPKSPVSIACFSHWKLQELAGFDLCRVESLELIPTILSVDGRGNIKEMAFSVVFV